MRTLLVLTVLLILTAPLPGCASKSYMIRTHQGREYVADGPPRYDVRSATYTFIDEQGREVVISKNDIRLIKEQ